MITVLYFASLRDQFKTDSESIEWHSDFIDVNSVKQHLAARGGYWDTLNSSNQIMVAVNQEMAENQTPVKDNDEVAFFPPVTGG